MYKEEIFVDGKSIGFFEISDKVEEAVESYDDLIVGTSELSYFLVNVKKNVAYWRIDHIDNRIDEIEDGLKYCTKENESIEIKLLAS